jgi:hypothetical protein
VLIEDCSVGPREQVLNVPSWDRSHAGDMGPVNLVVGHRQELGLRLLLLWLVRERS